MGIVVVVLGSWFRCLLSRIFPYHGFSNVTELRLHKCGTFAYAVSYFTLQTDG